MHWEMFLQETLLKAFQVVIRRMVATSRCPFRCLQKSWGSIQTYGAGRPWRSHWRPFARRPPASLTLKQQCQKRSCPSNCNPTKKLALQNICSLRLTASVPLPIEKLSYQPDYSPFHSIQLHSRCLTNKREYFCPGIRSRSDLCASFIAVKPDGVQVRDKRSPYPVLSSHYPDVMNSADLLETSCPDSRSEGEHQASRERLS